MALTGVRSACVSKWGANDMVGNVAEWVSTWGQSGNDKWQPTGHALQDISNELYGKDMTVEVQTTHRQGDGKNFPAAWIRGGSFRAFSGAGVFAIDMSHSPSDNAVLTGHIGFRCAREP
jgi:formylglycine-generating enzyme required for sulfatase activity